MNRTNPVETARWLVALAILFLLMASVFAQTQKTDGAVFKLGDELISIPAPAGFEEAASQFETIKRLMSSTESPNNDVLAVHLLHADCERVRAGGFGPFNFYTKVSVLRIARDQDFSAADFADVVSSFRKRSSQLLDVNGPTMKGAIERLDKGLSELNKQETQVDFSQVVNLGEFDTRPNVYSFMLVLSFTTQTGGSEKRVPLLAGTSIITVKKRLVFVYTYRKYDSATDVEVLRDFTKKWIDQILAAN